MNNSQRATLELLIILAIAIVITANRTSRFWQALFTRQPFAITPPDLSALAPKINIGGGGGGGAVGGAVGATGGAIGGTIGGAIGNG